MYSSYSQNFISITLLLIFIALPFNARSDDNRHTLPIIHSWHDILWDRLWEKGLTSSLSEDKYNLLRFDLDAMRLNPSKLIERENEAFEWIVNLNPPLVVLGDDHAMKALATRLLDRGIWVVFLGINHNPRKYIQFKHHYQITGILERSIYKRAITELAKLWPNKFKRILLLNEIELGDRENVTDLNKQFMGRMSVNIGLLSIDLEIASTWEQWKAKVLSAKDKGYDAILFDSRYMLRDQNNNYIEPEHGVVAWMQKNSKIPIFSFYEDSVGPGLAIGGYLVSGIEQGKKAGKLVKMILEKNLRPNEIRIISRQSGKWIFSREELKKWDLNIPNHLLGKATFVEDMHKLYIFN